MVLITILLGKPIFNFTILKFGTIICIESLTEDMAGNHHEMLASGELREKVKLCLKDLDGGGPAAKRFSAELSRLLTEAEESKARQDASKRSIKRIESKLVEDECKLKETNENTDKNNSVLKKEERERAHDLEYLQSLEAANEMKKQEVRIHQFLKFG